ncbi:FG-GAP repeat domain-containing protein [Puerhibacterium puerhi]|uniref:FG-GAP repeat domain-containing protein n=1 Tax=Puerhibacterium puerhi TaxID=2692623 RepID=UPI00135AE63A|nr:VCBS repeat-containing protein [Puerhibacterium puerhi]
MSLRVPRGVRLAAALCAVAVTAAVLMAPAQAASGPAPQAAGPVQAAAITDFNAGYIISDGAMYDSTSMSQSEIASFLATRGKSCRASTGNTCLKDYRESTPTRPATDLCPRTYSGARNETAAAIIAKVGIACGINPQVLLVTLQKEQGLITDSNGASAHTYSRALGFGCPDNTGGVCDSRYAGFANQVYSAARQLQRYAAYPTSYAHRAGATNQVRYHPNKACGSSSVYIRNQATASLYNYTPYQPNKAALAAGVGRGDSCSEYGNRNFHYYFKTWFGGATANRVPDGRLDSLTVLSTTSIRVTGWAFDPDTSSPITVQVNVDGAKAASFRASGSRPDVARANGHGTSGYSGTVTLTPGDHTVCVYAINSPSGSNPRLGCSDVSLSSGKNYFLNDSWTGSANHVFPYGVTSDVVYVGDWDGNRKDSLAVRRGRTFYINNRLGAGKATQVISYGRPGDTALVGDWDGDGKDTLAVRRGNTYYFNNRLATGEAERVVTFGRADDAVLVGDWNGDGKDTLAVRRGNTYYISNRLATGEAEVVIRYGKASDAVLAGDWNGDGKDTLAVRRGRTYYVNDSLSGGEASRILPYGRSTDVALAGDWNGDGKDTLGVRRP